MLPVSVIIVNYNAGPSLSSAVVTLVDAVKEIIVIDNASSDDSLKILEQANREARSPLRLIRNTANRGFAAACNQGTSVSTQDFLLFLNPDCVMTKASLQQLLDTLQRHPKAGMAGGLLLNPDGSEQRGGRRLAPNPWLALRRALWLDRWSGATTPDFNLDNTPLPTAPAQVEAISGACMLVRRSAVQIVGAWDEAFFLHCEDLDWCIRFRNADFDILFDPAATITHEKGTCSRSRPWFVEWHKHRGMLRYFRKHLAHGAGRVMTPVIALLLAGRYILLSAALMAKHLGKPRK